MSVHLTMVHNDAASALLNLYFHAIKREGGQASAEATVAALGCLAGQELVKNELGASLATYPEGQPVLSKAVEKTEALFQFLAWCCSQLKVPVDADAKMPPRKGEEFYASVLVLNQRLAASVEIAFTEYAIPADERPHVCLLAAAKAVVVTKGALKLSVALGAAGHGMTHGVRLVPLRSLPN